MVTKERHGIIMSTILFLLYIFVFLLTELTVNARSTVILGSDHVVTLYAIGLHFLGICRFFPQPQAGKQREQ